MSGSIGCARPSYYLLERALITAEGEDSSVAKAVGAKTKEWLSVTFYAAAIGLAFVSASISVAIYLMVAGDVVDPRSAV